jgi:hypothetical protein
MKKCQYLLLVVFMFIGNFVYSQVKVDPQNDVGVGTLLPVTAAKLQIESTDKGFLKPRLSTVQMNALQFPIAGLEIYNTSENRTYWYNGTAWVTSPSVQAGTGISVSGAGITGNPYIISTNAGATSQNLGNIVNLIYNDENPSTEYANSTVESTALKSYNLAANTYSQIIIEVVTRCRMDQDASSRPTYTWRIKSGTTTVETVVQRLVSNNTAGIDGGGTHVNTISTAIAGGQTALTSLTVTAAMSVANASVTSRVEAIRIYGVSNNLTVNTLIGAPGAAGAMGPAGAAGPVNSLAIGTVSTGTPGSSASATITGTAPNQTLNLTIPTGANGSPGAQGIQGLAGIGGVTTAGAGISVTGSGTPGSPYVVTNTSTGSVSNVTGTAPISVLNSTTTPIVSLNDGGVTSIKLADNSVITSKVANDAITTLKIANSNVTPAKIQAGTNGQILTTSGTTVVWGNVSTLLNGTTWNQNGNSVVTPKTLGTIDNFALPIITNNIERMRIDNLGNVGIGTNSPLRMLDVNGSTRLRGALHDKDDQTGLADELLVSTGTQTDWKDINLLGWKLGGNTFTSEQKLGTISAHDIPIILNNVERLRIEQTGRIRPSHTGDLTQIVIGNNGGPLSSSGFRRSIFIGDAAGQSLSTYWRNIFIGSESGKLMTIGQYNCFMGAFAGTNILNGDRNTFIGDESGSQKTSGSDNTFIGMGSGLSNVTGSNNVMVGVQAGQQLEGNNNVVIGNIAGPTAQSTLNNTIIIGYDAIATTSNQVVLGNYTTTTGGGTVNWTTTSDGRIKKDINESVLGLSFIKKLRPVQYKMDMDAFAKHYEMPDSTRLFESELEKAKITYSGFIAQEVESVANELNFNFSGIDKPQNTKSLYGLRYAEFVVPLVKAVQEQQEMIDAQKSKISILESENQLLKSSLQLIEERLKKLENK